MREGLRDLSNATAITELKITSDKSLAFCSFWPLVSRWTTMQPLGLHLEGIPNCRLMGQK